MKDLIKGQKVKLEELSAGSSFEIGLSCQAGGMAAELGCFGLDDQGRQSDDRYVIFRHQRRSPDGAIESRGGSGSYDECFGIDLGRLSSAVVRLVFIAAFDSDATFADLSSGHLDLVAGGRTAASFKFAARDFFSREKAIIIGELYLKNDAWSLSVVSQGFKDGLPALLKHFSREKIPSSALVSQDPSLEPRTEPKVNLSKVRLDKQGEKHKISLSKDNDSQVFHINLQWDQPSSKASPPGSFLGRLFSGGQSENGADLDLGCMWLDRQGHKGVIQPLGDSFGARHEPPYILLDKDDRSGAADDGENMRLYRPDTLALVLIFAMIYEGTANFSHVNARLTIFNGREEEILIPLNAPDTQRTFCAVAMIINNGDSIQVSKEGRYFSNHLECDQFYGFGFRWVAGRK